MKKDMTKIAWFAHTIFFLFFLTRYRIPIFVVPWMVLYLIHCYNVWYKPKTMTKSDIEVQQIALEKRINSLDVSNEEKAQMLDLSRELVAHILNLSTLNIASELEIISHKLTEADEDNLKEVLNEKHDLLVEISVDLKRTTNTYITLSERIELLKLQEVQSVGSTIEIEDLQERLKQKNDINRIMNKLSQYE